MARQHPKRAALGRATCTSASARKDRTCRWSTSLPNWQAFAAGSATIALATLSRRKRCAISPGRRSHCCFALRYRRRRAGSAGANAASSPAPTIRITRPCWRRSSPRPSGLRRASGSTCPASVPTSTTSARCSNTASYRPTTTPPPRWISAPSSARTGNRSITIRPDRLQAWDGDKSFTHGAVWQIPCWYRFARPDKRRPVLILTRDSILPYLGEVTVAPITSTARDIPSEVALSCDDVLQEGLSGRAV
ncbi:MAG: type II toxin-antitoxin system PemK/MazF family toxin [Thermoguttaceae bacterium]|nr:type II toxin-antitoxin system PemK/MazF family toxin [Thermoguttaceae bacterium]